MGDVLTERRSWNHDRLEAVRSEVAGSEHAGACVYVTGSFARGEASAFSDLDLFIVSADGDEGLCELDAICLTLLRGTIVGNLDGRPRCDPRGS